MRSSILILGGLLLTGCPKHSGTTGPSHPELVCPDASDPVGAVPPAGTEAWCQKLDAKGQWAKHGTYLAWHDNGAKLAQGQYLEGKKDGPWTYWFATEEVERQGSFSGGVEDGFWVSFHVDGHRSAEGKMVDGKEHGPWVYWSEGGQTRTEGAWKLGKREGTWTTYDNKDTPISEAVYRAGRMMSKREL